MESWRQWRDLMRESERAARLAEAEGCPRSAASRYYYAAYQAVTALLVYRGLTPPTDQEGWSHVLTPTLLRDETATLIPSRDRRNDLAMKLRELYDLRIEADYIASRTVSQGRIVTARRDSGFIVSIMGNILTEG